MLKPETPAFRLRRSRSRAFVSSRVQPFSSPEVWVWPHPDTGAGGLIEGTRFLYRQIGSTPPGPGTRGGRNVVSVHHPSLVSPPASNRRNQRGFRRAGPARTGATVASSAASSTGSSPPGSASPSASRQPRAAQSPSGRGHPCCGRRPLPQPIIQTNRET